MAQTSEQMTEQERIAAVCSMYAIYRAVVDGGYREVIDVASGIPIQSIDVARVTGIPLEVVNAALENIEDLGGIEIDDIEVIEEEPEDD